VRHAVFLPPVGPLADPRALVDLAVAAEEVGWDGFFLWDHVLRPPSEPPEIADPWVALAAIAVTTRRLRLGPMVTPIVRRRPQSLARETVTLDHLSGGRLTLGLGLGVDSAGELSRFGEPTDARQRGDILDEGLDLLAALWSGAPVEHRGPWFTADGVAFLPTPLQRPRIPVWLAARGDARRPVRRAARWDGLFPIDVDVDGLGRMLDLVVAERGGLEGFEVAVRVRPGDDVGPFAAIGATWAMVGLDPGATVATATAMIEQVQRP
jgi:alkanesulfonate monooxygenase SsuD/methylene tetrahydromethanopterin reductase-like flavin-dependent oxidoreductase (luciferase family)